MLLIFDWDGTLCDSTQKIVVCVQKAAADVGLTVLPEETVLDIIGLGIMEALHKLYPGASLERLHRLRESYKKWYLELDDVPSPLFAGVEETLIKLRDEGYMLTIATGKGRAGLDRILASLKLTTLFHGSRCADETRSKPDPLMVFELLDQFKYPRQHALVVGDTEYDMEMARRAEVARVAVTYGAHHIDRLVGYLPSFSIDSFPQILAGLSGGSLKVGKESDSPLKAE